MKLVMTLLARDEEDILEENIEYHLSRGIDYFIVTDNLSVDRTPEILEKYSKKGLMKVIFEPSDNYSQGEWVTRMARMAFSDYRADWIINSDADEFWWPNSEHSLKNVFANVPEGWTALCIPRLEFLPVQWTSCENCLQTMVYRMKESTNLMGDPLQPKVCHRGFQEVRVQQGNHVVYVDNVRLEEKETSELCIFHFPLRSYDQFANKIVKGGAAYKRNRKLNTQMGYTWKYLYNEEREDRLFDYFLDRSLMNKDIDHLCSIGEIIKDERLARYLNMIS